MPPPVFVSWGACAPESASPGGVARSGLRLDSLASGKRVSASLWAVGGQRDVTTCNYLIVLFLLPVSLRAATAWGSRSAENLALSPRTLQPGVDSRDDHRPLELREDAHDLEQRSAGWRQRVQALLRSWGRATPDPFSVHLGHHGPSGSMERTTKEERSAAARGSGESEVGEGGAERREIDFCKDLEALLSSRQADPDLPIPARTTLVWPRALREVTRPSARGHEGSHRQEARDRRAS